MIQYHNSPSTQQQNSLKLIIKFYFKWVAGQNIMLLFIEPQTPTSNTPLNTLLQAFNNDTLLQFP